MIPNQSPVRRAASSLLGLIVLPAVLLACELPTDPDDGPHVRVAASGALDFEVTGTFDLPAEGIEVRPDHLDITMIIALPADDGERIRQIRVRLDCPEGFRGGRSPVVDQAHAAGHPTACNVQFVFATLAGGITFFRSTSGALILDQAGPARLAGVMFGPVQEYDPADDDRLVPGGHRVDLEIEFRVRAP